MAYHTSIYLFLFLPAVLLAYQLTPEKVRWVTLVLSGYIFFWSISGKLVLYLIGTTLVTHYIGVWISSVKLECKIAVSEAPGEERNQIKKQYKRREKMILAGGIILLLSALLYLKYYNFFAQNVNRVLETAGSEFALQAKVLILPIGISFYTLQAIGYMVDVYWGKSMAWSSLRGKLLCFWGSFRRLWKVRSVCIPRRQIGYGKEILLKERTCPKEVSGFCGDCLRR